MMSFSISMYCFTLSNPFQRGMGADEGPYGGGARYEESKKEKDKDIK